jgi:uncharacterized protein (TIGR03083 family)
MPTKLDRSGALRAQRQAVIALCRTLSDEEWRAPSTAKGWRLQDVVAHMGGAFHGLFQPGWVVGLLKSDALERGNDDDVAKRADWAPQDVLGEYETWSRRAIATLAFTAKTPATALPLRLGELGSYPAGIFLSAFTFDHHTHLNHDMAAAIGRPPVPIDANGMAVALQWMFAGAEQMHGTEMAFLEEPVASPCSARRSPAERSSSRCGGPSASPGGRAT